MTAFRFKWMRNTWARGSTLCMSLFQWVRNRWTIVGTSDKISSAALLVSLFAISLAIQESHRTREHERLSVVPKLVVRFVDGSDGDITGIILDNQGLGPARILNVRLSIGENSSQKSRAMINGSLYSINSASRRRMSALCPR
jgi:hypothetical protein